MVQICSNYYPVGFLIYWIKHLKDSWHCQSQKERNTGDCRRGSPTKIWEPVLSAAMHPAFFLH
jgi:hypothetical protein